MLHKRPERVLQKGEIQTVYCSCGGQNKAPAGNVSVRCSKCGEEINWGLRK